MAMMMKSAKVSAARPSSARPTVVVAAAPANWRSALATEAPAKASSAKPSATPSRPVTPVPSARPTSRSTKPANFQRTSPEALAQFRREMGSLTGAPASSSASSYTPAKPAAAAPSPSSWRSEAPARPASASSAEVRPSSRTPKPNPATFQRTSPEALAQFRREVGSLTGNAAPSSASSYTPSKPAAAAPSPSSWRSEAPAKAAAPAPSARPASSKPGKPVIKRTSPEALAAFRREMGGI